VARVLIVAAVVLSMNRVLGASLRALGRPLDAGVPEFLALAVTAGGLALLLPPFGIMGAAIVSLLAYGASTGWMLLRVARALDVPVFSVVLVDASDLRRLRRIASPGRARIDHAAEVAES